jgi:hypothetical protein
VKGMTNLLHHFYFSESHYYNSCEKRMIQIQKLLRIRSIRERERERETEIETERDRERSIRTDSLGTQESFASLTLVPSRIPLPSVSQLLRQSFLPFLEEEEERAIAWRRPIESARDIQNTFKGVRNTKKHRKKEKSTPPQVCLS